MLHASPGPDKIDDHIAGPIDGNYNIMALIVIRLDGILQDDTLARIQNDLFRRNLKIIAKRSKWKTGVKSVFVTYE